MTQAITDLRAAPPIDYGGLAKQILQPWSDAYETWRSGVSNLLEKPMNKTSCDCEACRSVKCGPNPCECRCCVANADLLLEARVGERRVISLEIENRWRRERDIELELSSWTATPDEAAVSAQIVGSPSFTLAPCANRLVAIEVSIGGSPNEDQREELGDVKECVVSYADLRILGCEIRSVRIAVAVLPRDCDAYKVDCASGCC